MVIILSLLELYATIRLGITYMYNGWHMIAVFNYIVYLIGFALRGMSIHVLVCSFMHCMRPFACVSCRPPLIDLYTHVRGWLGMLPLCLLMLAAAYDLIEHKVTEGLSNMSKQAIC